MKNFLKSWTVRTARRGLNSTRKVALSFALIILTGTLLLMLPVMSHSGQSAGPLTALFTATSATCVTGLAVVDTVSQWTLGGQIVILLLIQLGGLGFMTAYSLLLMTFQRKIGLSQRMMIASTFSLNSMDGVVRLVRHALLGTFLFEGGGAALLAIRFIPEFGLWKGLWYSVFHAVSAFCNAGFDLMGVRGDASSLMIFSHDPFVLMVHVVLIVIGGLGFFVWEDIYRHRRFRKLSLYSRLVLVCTGLLIMGGWIYFLLVESGNPMTFGKMGGMDKIWNTLLQSVTLRTAGFSSINQGGLRDSSLVICILFMLIGGSSGSTAGGIKTVTAAVLVLALRTGLRGQEDVTVGGRTIPHRQVIDAMTLALTVMLIFIISSMAISLIEGTRYLPIAYEVASAMGTVGLTTGLTPGLASESKLILIALMYMGRVGILSFSLAFLTKRGFVSKVKYPTVDVIIG